MKKTMFITSVIMVVVLAIALTTSSLAWFSAGGAVSVSTGTLAVSAVEATAVGAGLEISRDNSSWSSANIPLAYLPDTVVNGDNSITVTPSMTAVAPCSLATLDGETGAITAIDALAFYNALTANSGIPGMYKTKITKNSENTPIFAANTNIARATSGNGHQTKDFYHDTFYIRNSGETATRAQCTATVTLTHASTSLTNARLWVAVFGNCLVDDSADKHPGDDGYTPTYERQLLHLICSVSGGMTYIFSVADSQENGYPDLIEADHEVSVIANQAPISAFSANNIYLPGGSYQEVNIGTAQDPEYQYKYVDGAAQTIDVFAWWDGNNLNELTRDTVVTISVGFEMVGVDATSRSLS